ncbi:MAG: CAP domain-containing protein [Parasphingorhabdus sp.]|uniref:CAP domain-containing protein n=1 Tax=Parasphingorhabdus sp. TaxID=2709688 RepID=UPI003264D463
MQVAMVALLAGCGGGEGGSVAGPPPVTLPGSPPTATPPGPAPAPAPTPAPTPTPSPTPPPTGTAMLDVMLAAHNQARDDVAVGPMALDADLNAAAQAYAEELIANGGFEHSPGDTRPGQGENLWAGTASAFSFQQMVDGWINEKRFFVRGVFPNVSTTGRWQDVGHYTQIIWRDTTKLGCGIASNAQRDVLVCRYSPPGNFIGQDPLQD